MVAATLVGLLLPAAAAQAPGYGVARPRILDPGGRTAILHGFNLVWKVAPYYPPSSIYPAPFRVSQDRSFFDERDATWLRDHGFNAVRLGIIWKGLQPHDAAHFDDTYVDRMRDLVGLLGRYGIAVLLDFHQDMANEQFQGEGFPDWAVHTGVATPAGELAALPATNCCGFPGNYFTPAVMRTFDNIWTNAFGLWNAYANAWAHVASGLGGEPNVIGYDIMNEPWPGTQWATCASPAGCPVFENLFLQRFHEHVAAAIRRVQPRGIVFWEPPVTDDFGAGNETGLVHPFKDPLNGISFHDYCLLGGQFVPGLSRADDPECQRTEPMVFQNQADAARRNGSALALTEFGASDDLVDSGRVLNEADGFALSWFFWQYQAWSDPTGNPAGEGMSTFDDQRRFTSFKTTKVDLLTESYPQAVAGTAGGWATVDGVFRFFYVASPTSPAITEIYLDPAEFPGAVTVHATGATPVACPSPRPHIVCVVNAAPSGIINVTIAPS